MCQNKKYKKYIDSSKFIRKHTNHINNCRYLHIRFLFCLTKLFNNYSINTDNNNFFANEFFKDLLNTYITYNNYFMLMYKQK